MKKMIVCNQKMYLLGDAAEKLNIELLKLNLSNIDFVICPNYLDYNVFNNFDLCSQDAYYKEGAYTSLISANALSEKGFKYSLVGHSYKRRTDSNIIINKKVIAILSSGMIPIICVGENSKEYENKVSLKVIKKQLKSALKDVSKDSNIIIAYEPVWSVATGNTMSPSELTMIINDIRNIVESSGFMNYKLLYGGSVTSQTVKEMANINIDGYLIGKASVDLDELKKIINCTQKV